MLSPEEEMDFDTWFALDELSNPATPVTRPSFPEHSAKPAASNPSQMQPSMHDYSSSPPAQEILAEEAAEQHSQSPLTRSELQSKSLQHSLHSASSISTEQMFLCMQEQRENDNRRQAELRESDNRRLAEQRADDNRRHEQLLLTLSRPLSLDAIPVG